MQILTTGKSYAEYVSALTQLRQIVPQFRPNLVVTDFEIALQQAWRQVFNATVTGCYWHYCRVGSVPNASFQFQRPKCSIPAF